MAWAPPCRLRGGGRGKQDVELGLEPAHVLQTCLDLGQQLRVALAHLLRALTRLEDYLEQVSQVVFAGHRRSLRLGVAAGYRGHYTQHAQRRQTKAVRVDIRPGHTIALSRSRPKVSSGHAQIKSGEEGDRQGLRASGRLNCRAWSRPRSLNRRRFTVDGTRARRRRDKARQAWYARHRQRRFARFLGFDDKARAPASPRGARLSLIT